MRAVPQIVVLHASTDGDAVDELRHHMANLLRERQARLWAIKEVEPGIESRKETRNKIDIAKLAILLVSADFIADTQLNELVEYALDRQHSSALRIIPILLRAVDGAGATYAGQATLPQNHQPVGSWPLRDEAWRDVVSGIRTLIGKGAICQRQRRFGWIVGAIVGVGALSGGGRWYTASPVRPQAYLKGYVCDALYGTPLGGAMVEILDERRAVVSFRPERLDDDGFMIIDLKQDRVLPLYLRVIDGQNADKVIPVAAGTAGQKSCDGSVRPSDGVAPIFRWSVP